MKRSRQLALLVMAQTPWLLTACDNTPEPVNKQGFYTSVDACVRDGNPEETCRRAAQTAETASNAPNAPRYKTKEECIAEFGDLCTERTHEGGGIWMPLMTGFLLSQVLMPNRPPAYLDATPIYRSRSGQYVETYRDRGYGGGTTWSTPGTAGPRMRPIDVPPNRAITVSRSGFGSMSAARSGWGGS
ncbi:MAG TPA: DUF1190 domain-containing protein [Rhodanobacteraceae bacterium]|nr:DUF1190 domain-containing protein [Rhodanobacteraceae bacterium]